MPSLYDRRLIEEKKQALKELNIPVKPSLQEKVTKFLTTVLTRMLALKVLAILIIAIASFITWHYEWVTTKIVLSILRFEILVSVASAYFSPEQ